MSEPVVAPVDPRRKGWVTPPSHRWFLVELLALAGFAITQPVLAVFGQSVDTFVFRKSTATEVVLFALIVAIVPAVVVWLVTTLIAKVVPRASLAIKTLAVVSFVALVVAHAGKDIFGLHHRRLIAVVIAVSLLAGLVYARSRIVHDFLRFGAFGQVMFVGLFVFSSTVTPLVFGDPTGGSQAVASGKRVSIAMLVFDEWPTAAIIGADGNIDADLFPNLARLSGTSTWYRNATGISNATTYAVPAIMTGKIQKSGAVPLASSQPNSVFSLARSQYKLNVSESVTAMCGACWEANRGKSDGSLSALLGDAKSVLHSIVSPSNIKTDVTARFTEEAETPAQEKALDNATTRRTNLFKELNKRLKRFNDFTTSFQRNEDPTLHFLHVLLPHVPHRFVPSGLSYRTPIPEIGRQSESWVDGPWATLVGRQRQLLQAMYADQLVGGLLDRLEDQGLLESTAIVVTADHGINIEPGQPGRAVTKVDLPVSTYPELLWSPLFIKGPGQTKGVRSDANVMSQDILPTLASLMNWKLPYKVDGKVAGTRTETTKLFQRGYGDRVGAEVKAPVEFDGAAGFREMLRRNLASFTKAGTTAEDARWQPWRVGEYAALVGTNAPKPVPGTSSMTATVDQRDELAKVDPTTGQIPAMLWGTANRDGRVAVVLRGKIVGISPTFTSVDKRMWTMMVPEFMLESGRNDVELFEVTGTAATPIFQRMNIG